MTDDPPPPDKIETKGVPSLNGELASADSNVLVTRMTDDPPPPPPPDKIEKRSEP